MINNATECGTEGVPEIVMPVNSIIAGVEVLKGGTKGLNKKKATIFLPRGAVKLLKNIKY